MRRKNGAQVIKTYPTDEVIRDKAEIRPEVGAQMKYPFVLFGPPKVLTSGYIVSHNILDGIEYFAPEVGTMANLQKEQPWLYSGTCLTSQLDRVIVKEPRYDSEARYSTIAPCEFGTPDEGLTTPSSEIDRFELKMLLPYFVRLLELHYRGVNPSDAESDPVVAEYFFSQSALGRDMKRIVRAYEELEIPEEYEAEFAAAEFVGRLAKGRRSEQWSSKMELDEWREALREKVKASFLRHHTQSRDHMS